MDYVGGGERWPSRPALAPLDLSPVSPPPHLMTLGALHRVLARLAEGPIKCRRAPDETCWLEDASPACAQWAKPAPAGWAAVGWGAAAGCCGVSDGCVEVELGEGWQEGPVAAGIGAVGERVLGERWRKSERWVGLVTLGLGVGVGLVGGWSLGRWMLSGLGMVG